MLCHLCSVLSSANMALPVPWWDSVIFFYCERLLAQGLASLEDVSGAARNTGNACPICVICRHHSSTPHPTRSFSCGCCRGFLVRLPSAEKLERDRRLRATTPERPPPFPGSLHLIRHLSCHVGSGRLLSEGSYYPWDGQSAFWAPPIGAVWEWSHILQTWV